MKFSLFLHFTFLACLLSLKIKNWEFCTADIVGYDKLLVKLLWNEFTSLCLLCKTMFKGNSGSLASH